MAARIETATGTPGAQAARLLHRGLGRAELFDFLPEDLAGGSALRAQLEAEGLQRLSFHAPMPRPGYFAFPGVACFYLCEDEWRRELSFSLLEDTLRAAADMRAEYVVTHLTYGRTDTLDPVRARRLAHAACARIGALARRYDVPVNIEYAAYTGAFHDPQAFVDVVAEHGELGLCIDTGHAAIGAQMRGRDYLDDIRALAPLARAMHLWNTRGEAHYRTHGHTPLHPAQAPAEGWIDIEAALDIVLAHNPQVAIVFEYPVAEVDATIRAGYEWIAAHVAGAARKYRTTEANDE